MPPILSRPQTLYSMPLEIIVNIAEFLRAEFLFDLGLTCKYFHRLVSSETLGQAALKQAKYSLEGREVQSTRAYAKAFRRLAKTRKAIQSGDPYLVALLAFSSHFIYTDGHLCYSEGDDRFIRVLDVHGSAVSELEVSVPDVLVFRAVPFFWDQPYQFLPINFCDGMLSCLLTQRIDATANGSGISFNWLVVLHLNRVEVVVCRQVSSVEKLFVRNNQHHLIYGTNSATMGDGTRKWELTHINLRPRAPNQMPANIYIPKMVLLDFSAATIGADISFEIFGEYLYVLSTDGRAHPRIPWNSFYLCHRYPLNNFMRGAGQCVPETNVWRRHADEGYCDFRWASLQLVKDQQSGALWLYEIRREVLPQNSQSQRSCYRKEIRFDNQDSAPISVPKQHIVSLAQLYGLNHEGMIPDQRAWYLAGFKEQRRAEDVHVGDNEAFGSMYPMNECFVRTYVPSCNTFIDIVSSPSLATPNVQQLRLRARPKLHPGGDSAKSATVHDNEGPSNGPTGESRVGVDREKHHEVRTWPRDRDSTQSQPPMNILRDILSVPVLGTDMDWAMDDRALVYSPEGPGDFKPIVLVSFDPAIHLPGFRRVHPPFRVDTPTVPEAGVIPNEIFPEDTWLRSVPAFYTQAPQLDPDHCYGVDMTR